MPQCKCILCAKRLKIHQRRPVNNHLIKYLRKNFLLESTQSDFICGTCSRPAYPNSDTLPKTKQTPTSTNTTPEPVSQIGSPPSVCLNIKRVTKSHAYCFICKKPGPRLVLVPASLRTNIFIQDNILIMADSRCCPSHMDDDLGSFHPTVRSQLNTLEYSCLNRTTILELLDKVRQVALNSTSMRMSFDHIETLSDEDMVNLTGLQIEQFLDLHTITKSMIKNTPTRSSLTTLGLFLFKLKSGLSNKFISTLFGISKASIRRAVHTVRQILMQEFVSLNLGFSNVSRKDLLERHTRVLAQCLLAENKDQAILVLDGTYIYINKSSNFKFQRRSFSMHKGRPLVKPMIITSTTGYFVSVLGPYFADSKNNDASILNHILSNNIDEIKNWVEANDIFVVDRGFRDSIELMQDLGIHAEMPVFMKKGDKQMTTEDSNSSRLVTKCQVRFGGRTELATDTDSRVSCLCEAWEGVLLHGLRGNKTITAIKQVSEITGLNKVTGIFAEKSTERETAFWFYVREILTKHEGERFLNMKNIHTDSGRGRAWLRAALNEHSLERYMHMLIESDGLLGQYYDPWSFLRDQEKSSMLPMMARGLDSILFAISVDNPELNSIRTAPGIVVNPGLNAAPVKMEEDLRPVIAGDASPIPIEKKKDKKKKKKVKHIVSFDDNESGSGKFSRVSGQLEKSGSFTESPSNSFSTSLETLPVFTSEIIRSPVGDGAISDEQTVRQTNKDNVIDRRSDSGNYSEHSLRRTMSKNPSIGSGISDSRRSQGSFSSADFELSMEMSSSMTPITPNGEPGLDDDYDDTLDNALLSRSVDSSNMPSYNGDDIESATFALKQAQLSFHESHRTQGDGGNVSEDIKNDRMSTEELKKAVVSMMLRKDEVEEQNKSLKQMLEQEMDTSSILRAEIEQMKHTASVKHEKEQSKLIALQKENELLKHQLRKYVNAVQMLRTEGSTVDVNLGIHVDDPQPTIPPEKPKTDYSHEAEEYEKKLIQVAEMHGELMEFNELLHRQLNLKENLLKRLQNELISLRGPLPNDISFTDDPLTMNTDGLSIQSTTLINVWIPSAFLRGSASDSHHVYQVYVRIKDEEWNIYKRYKQFDELHSNMKKKFPLSGSFDFPKKKSFGKKDAKVVESRRHLLQTYLRCLINLVLEKSPSLSQNVCKQTLLEFMPFFSDKIADKDKKQKKKSESSPLSSSPRQTAPVPEPYSGL